MRYATKSLALAEQLGDRLTQALILNNVGSIYSNLNDIANAEHSLKQAKAIFEQINFKQGYASCLNNLGTVFRNLKKYDSAEFYFQKSARIRIEIEDESGLAINYENLGDLSSDLGDNKKALEYYQKSLHIAETKSLFVEVVNVSLKTGKLLMFFNKKEEAHKVLDRALRIAKEKKTI